MAMRYLFRPISSALCLPLLLVLSLLPCSQVLASGVEMFIGRPPEPSRARQAGRKPRVAGTAVSPGGRFKQLDTNHDGRISRQEMEHGNRARIQAFERADANADGQLSADEWRAYKGSQSGGKKKRKSAAF
jgi:EF hand